MYQEHGAELRHLSSDPIQTDCSKVVYLVRSQMDLMRFICSHIQNDISKGLQREYFVYFVPRRTVVCEKVRVGSTDSWSNLKIFKVKKSVHILIIKVKNLNYAGSGGGKGSSPVDHRGVSFIRNPIG